MYKSSKKDEDMLKEKKLGVKITIPKDAEIFQAPDVIEHHEPHYECIIGIGKDYTATLLIDPDSLGALRMMKSGRSQVFNPKSCKWVLIDTEKGIVLESKSKPYNDVMIAGSGGLK